MPHPPASPPSPPSQQLRSPLIRREREQGGGEGAVSTSWLPQSPPSSTTIAIRDTITAGLLCRPETGKHLTTPPKCHQLPLPAIGYALKWFLQIQEKTFANTRENFYKYKRKHLQIQEKTFANTGENILESFQPSLAPAPPL